MLELSLHGISYIDVIAGIAFTVIGFFGIYFGLRGRFDDDERRGLVTPQPPPRCDKDQPAVWEMVVADMFRRDEDGAHKYGMQLRPHNGRDALVDSYQEALDLCVYLRQAIFERDGE